MLYSHLRAKAHLVRDIASVDAAQTEVFVGNGSLQKEVPRKATFGWLFALNAAHSAKSTCNEAWPQSGKDPLSISPKCGRYVQVEHGSNHFH